MIEKKGLLTKEWGAKIYGIIYLIAFFFYLMGPYPFYHDVNDQATALPLTNFEQAFMLFQSFISQLQNQ